MVGASSTIVTVLFERVAGVTEELAGGDRYLHLVTRLAHRIRLADPLAGVWEAADFQWWWRRPHPSGDLGQQFWLDEAGEPVAAVVLTGWSGRWQCDVLAADGAPIDPTMLHRRALELMAERQIEVVEMAVPDNDPEAIADLLAAGFVLDEERGVSCWLDAADRPAITPLPGGFKLHTRSATRDRPHPMITRNGPAIAKRLAQCSLYSDDLDLMVETDDGQLAAYSMYWADLVTGVGLVEPMRTEEAFEGLGIATHMLTTGLNLLAKRGCTRLKVGAGRGLYTNVGFVPLTTNVNLSHEGPW